MNSLNISSDLLVAVIEKLEDRNKKTVIYDIKEKKATFIGIDFNAA